MRTLSLLGLAAGLLVSIAPASHALCDFDVTVGPVTVTCPLGVEYQPQMCYQTPDTTICV